ncbi:pentatricopeptide repeat-containing protein At5g52850, chloroplastic [Triticum aestivum]|uniref:Pentacotripeptide-repeat region of PRORP domain-containing protein n=1 Tax=Triticum aestivum TaxID=4565 RepID=A0A3B6LZ34_WHEAT|nr:pentatricopeptide repeat-containing protein At5g52850, chloroplastic-like [Triticum aestivum]XP_044391959.1 pentatricopeptide repeat-containing protein At5g52850, chloroplastic-like [Triticum aestivum]XP_044391960.1 pentatricopeptide repeat-containing protein At5g52850, chloroplastic-like [Triticum aestivum]XP_044391961.1 pentatricopeptide repeat-containing protein At5g52850, chloroplastic-like [Triticum aestivum]XP_044391962.1 pentatricopeptide repeat-containing protein At5g52850, chloropla
MPLRLPRHRRHLAPAPCVGQSRAAASWAAAVADHARAGRHAAALTVFRRVLAAHPAAAADELAYSALLRCRDARLGYQIHAQACRRGLAASNPVLACSLLAFYSAARSDLPAAARLFDEMPMPRRDAVAYTAMMSAFIRAGDWARALALYPRMLAAGDAPPTEHTFANLLALCASRQLCCHGRQLHAQLLRWGADLNLVLKTALLHMYSSCGFMDHAHAVLCSTPDTDVVLWTAMIAGYSRAGDLQAALRMFRHMEQAGVLPSAFTFSGIITACASSSSAQPQASQTGRQLHARVFKFALEHDISVCNALVDLYSKSSARLLDLLHAFSATDSPNVVSWTALISGLARHGRDKDAFAAFAEMRASEVQPNSFTVSTLLKGCGSSESFLHATKIHAYVLKTSLGSLDVSVGNSLVDLYSRFARMDDAWAVATTMVCARDNLTYTSLAKGLNQIGLPSKALELVVLMFREEVRIDGFSLACFLSAAATLPSVVPGKHLHCCSLKLGLSSQVPVSNSLINMYSKHKCVEDAKSVFHSIREPSVVSWNALISGLAYNNECYYEALSVFEDMTLAGAQPDSITFSAVLYACTHGGFVDIGINHFNSMRNSFGVSPQRSHYTLFLDMLGRAGRLTEAACTIEAMPIRPDVSMYKNLLAFCELHNDLVVAENITRKALELYPSDTVFQNTLSGISGAPWKHECGAPWKHRMKSDADIQAKA